MTRKRIGMVFSIVLLLVISYFIPDMVALVEDKNLKNEAKTYTIENVLITQNENRFFEELDCFPDIMSEPAMYVKAGKNLSAEQVNELGIQFAQLIFAAYEHVPVEDIAIASLKRDDAGAYIATSPDYETVYYLWNSNFIDFNGNEYTLWIDDTTGKVLGFMCPLPEQFWKDVSVMEHVAAVLAEYYGYEKGVFYYPYEIGTAAFVFYNEHGVRELMLPITFSDKSIFCNLTDNEYTVGYYDMSITEADKSKLK